MESRIADPWCEGNISNTVEGLSTDFEDNFTVTIERNKLPDSAEYLASLEKKLARIKSGKSKGNKGTSEGRALLKSLEESGDSCMYRLISGETGYSLTEQDLLLETPTKLTASAKWVNPEQALTVGELVELVKADYLAQQMETDLSEDKSSENSFSLSVVISAINRLLLLLSSFT